MGYDSINPNPRHRYALSEAAYLVDAEETRYVLIAPDDAGFLVEHGTLVAAASDDPPRRVPDAAAERFPPDGLAVVQRVCALAAGRLDYNEWEVEQTRRLFLVRG